MLLLQVVDKSRKFRDKEPPLAQKCSGTQAPERLSIKISLFDVVKRHGGVEKVETLAPVKYHYPYPVRQGQISGVTEGRQESTA